MTTEKLELTEDQQKRLAVFDPSKPFIIKADEVPGLEEFGSARFVCKRPTVGDRLKIGIREAKYRDNLELGEGYNNIAHVLATFSVVCQESPKGFEFDGVFDYEPLFVLYDRFNEWLGFFRIGLQLRQEGASK